MKKETITKNTPENKEKFMAQYWGQHVLTDGNHVVKIPLDNVNLRNDSHHLVLRPLESITLDEIKKHFHSNAFKIVDPFKYGHKGPFANVHYRIKWTYTHPFTDKSKTYYSDKFITGYDLEHNHKLRSLGFLVPYADLSPKQLVEYGWVKLKN